MKVRVTIEVSDRDRYIIGTALDGYTSRQATREELDDFIVRCYEEALEKPREAEAERTKVYVAEIRESLGYAEV